MPHGGTDAPDEPHQPVRAACLERLQTLLQAFVLLLLLLGPVELLLQLPDPKIAISDRRLGVPGTPFELLHSLLLLGEPLLQGVTFRAQLRDLLAVADDRLVEIALARLQGGDTMGEGENPVIAHLDVLARVACPCPSSFSAAIVAHASALFPAPD